MLEWRNDGLFVDVDYVLKTIAFGRGQGATAVLGKHAQGVLNYRSNGVIQDLKKTHDYLIVTPVLQYSNTPIL